MKTIEQNKPRYKQKFIKFFTLSGLSSKKLKEMYIFFV